MPNLPESLAAQLAPRYRLLRELGRGGMAMVYLAHDVQHDRPVALKVLHQELAATLGPERFLQEIRLCARLQHPHVLSVHDSGEAEGRLWFTMPYVEGENLRQRLDREKQLPLDEALRYARQVAEALEYAHRQGVVHRDIKPENILLAHNQAIVADFGVARALRGDQERLTQTGFSLGTPMYMSPEQATGARELDARSDVYSLACVLYEMLAGEPPFTGPTAQAVIAKRLVEPVPRLGIAREVPEWVEAAVTRGLAKVPADRFASAAEFAAALERPTGTAPARRAAKRPTLVAAAALALALGGWLLSRWSPGPPPALVPTRLAVLPFGVPANSGFGYLAEGLVDLLSRNLNGADALVTVDPGSVLSVAGRIDGIPDGERGRDIARRLGAGQYVVGSLQGSGGRLRIQASLYDHAGPAPEALAHSTVDGDSTQLFSLVDRLSAELLAERGRGQGARLAQTAAVTTHSIEALKAYLEAEQHLRAARFDSALVGFRQAADLDTSFNAGPLPARRRGGLVGAARALRSRHGPGARDGRPARRAGTAAAAGIRRVP